MYFDQVFQKREKRIRKSLEIDDRLHVALEQCSKQYDATIGDLINACITNLLQSGQMPIYEYKNTLYVMHTIRITESNIREDWHG